MKTQQIARPARGFVLGVLGTLGLAWLPLAAARGVSQEGAEAAPREDLVSLALAPAPGTALRKVFDRRVSLARTGQTVVVGGGAPEVIESLFEIDETLHLELEDEYVRVGDGAVDALERRFVGALSTFEQREDAELQEGLQRLSVEAESGLVGRRVTFQRDAETGRQVATFSRDSEGSPPELLVDLVADTDLAGFLPAGPVRPGASWSIPPSELRHVLAPGGDLHLEAREGTLPRGAQASATADFRSWADGDGFEGTVSATLERTSTLDGRSLAHVRLELEVTSTQDQTAKGQEQAEGLAGDGDEGDIHFDFVEVSLAMHGSGELVWDTTRGLPHALELDATLGLVIDTGVTVTVEDVALEVEETSELAGTLALAMTTGS